MAQRSVQLLLETVERILVAPQCPAGDQFAPVGFHFQGRVEGVVSVPITVPVRPWRVASRCEKTLIYWEKPWSEWRDLNLRPPRPERGALRAFILLIRGLIVISQKPQTAIAVLLTPREAARSDH